MNGDVGLVENITGMQPDPEKHSSAFVIQPVSNLVVSTTRCLVVVVDVALIAATFNFATVNHYS